MLLFVIRIKDENKNTFQFYPKLAFDIYYTLAPLFVIPLVFRKLSKRFDIFVNKWLDLCFAKTLLNLLILSIRKRRIIESGESGAMELCACDVDDPARGGATTATVGAGRRRRTATAGHPVRAGRGRSGNKLNLGSVLKMCIPSLCSFKKFKTKC